MPTTRSGNPPDASSRRGNSTGRGQKHSTSSAGKMTSRGQNRGSTQARTSQAPVSTYKSVNKQLEAQKKAAKEAEDAAIRARNQELLDADGNESAEEVAPVRKRQKTFRDNVLSDEEEAELASGLPPVGAAAHEFQDESGDPDENDGSPAHTSAGEEDLPGDLDEVTFDEADVEMDLTSADSELSNALVVESGREDGMAVAPKTSRPKADATKSARSKTPTGSRTSNSKVVEKDFSPKTLRLALAAKSHVRTRSVFDEPFPRNNKISRINFAWRTIKESAAASSESEIRQAFNRATVDLNTKTKLMKFTLYGRTGLISSIISKARDKVRAYYGFVGDADVVKKDVEWLLTKSHFTYGGINLRERTVDSMKPFGAQIIVDIIESQWFPSTSRSKLDLETTNRIYEERDLPLNAVLLVVTAIEHALKEWSSTGRKACQITFSEDTARASFERHLRHWKFFESQTNAWPAWWRKTVLDQILANHTNLDFNEDDNDFADLDFSGLDRLAGYENQCDSDANAQAEGRSAVNNAAGRASRDVGTGDTMEQASRP